MVISTERVAASLFSTAAFRPVLAGRNSARIDSLVERLREDLFKVVTPRLSVINAAYKLLSKEYRSEYLYRNLITSRYFIGKHRAANSVLLHELRIGGSIADCVLINGHGNIYEIKTERDDPTRLESQFTNYRMAFPSVNLVVSETDQYKYMDVVDQFDAGLIVLTKRGHLSVIREPAEDYSGLNFRTMFNLLRSNEVAKILKAVDGRVPVVPNGKRYVAFLEEAEKIPLRSFQHHMQTVLRLRTIKNSKDLLLKKEYEPLRAIITQLDPSEKQQNRLLEWLRGV